METEIKKAEHIRSTVHCKIFLSGCTAIYHATILHNFTTWFVCLGVWYGLVIFETEYFLILLKIVEWIVDGQC